MTGTTIARWLLLCLLVAPGPAAAAGDDADELGVTMTVIDDEEAAGEEALVHEIELPASAVDEARELGSSGPGDARQQDRELVPESADEARELGREQGRPSTPGP